MGRVIDTTGEKVQAGQSSRFAPIPGGEYTVSLYDVEESTYRAESAGQGRGSYRVQLRVADGQPGANRRLFQTIPLFLNWGPTQKNPNGSDAFTFYDFFAAVYGVKSKDYRAAVKAMIATDKAEQKAALAEIKDEAVRAKFESLAGKGLSIPDPEELLGKKINVVLKVVPDTYAYNKADREGTLEDGETLEDFKTNDVSAWKPFAEVKQASVTAEEEGGFVL